MDIFINLLLWTHFIGLGMGVGGGIGLGYVGPRLVAATDNRAAELWGYEKFFGWIGSGGLGILLVTGPLILWLKFNGPAGLSLWFAVKMGFVALAIVGVALHQWAGARFFRGDRAAIPLMFIAGRLAGASMVLAMLCAVFTFN